MSNLRRTIDNIREHPQANRNTFERVLHKALRRSQEEVCEDAIPEIEIEKIQEILREDLDLIFDALVIENYIDEVDA